jgi:hypothetical protein
MNKRRLKTAIASIANSSMMCQHEQTEYPSILLGRFEFLGPYVDVEKLKSEPGLLSVLVHLDEEFQLLDLSDSANLRRSAWFAACSECPPDGTLAFAVYYTNELSAEERKALRNQVMKGFDNPD